MEFPSLQEACSDSSAIGMQATGRPERPRERGARRSVRTQEQGEGSEDAVFESGARRASPRRNACAGHRAPDALRRHDALYQDDAPEISDADYDVLRRELQDLETSPRSSSCPTSTQVVAVPAEGFETVLHRSPMLSLDNAMDADELRAFDAASAGCSFGDGSNGRGNRRFDYVAEPKLDGSGIELIYEKGRFVQGLTRGDGQTGEDVTTNLRHVPIPKTPATDEPPEIASVRGEIVLPLAAFEKLNRGRFSELRPFENPRSAAAGSLRQIRRRRLRAAGEPRVPRLLPGRWTARTGSSARAKPSRCSRAGASSSARRSRPAPRRRGDRLPRGPALEAGRAGRDRWHGREGRPSGTAESPRHPRPRAALGDRLQVPARTGGDRARGGRVPGRADRRTHPGRASRPRPRRRRDRLECLAHNQTIERKDIRVGDRIVIQRAGDDPPDRPGPSRPPPGGVGGVDGRSFARCCRRPARSAPPGRFGSKAKRSPAARISTARHS